MYINLLAGHVHFCFSINQYDIHLCALKMALCATVLRENIAKKKFSVSHVIGNQLIEEKNFFFLELIISSV